MTKQQRANEICKILKMAYPHVRTQLSHKNPFQLLAATILSAQCTDRQVNKTTKHLFTILKKPSDFAEVKRKTLEKLIYSTGFYKNKAKNLQNCAKYLIEHYEGVVPDTLEELLKLPGVGRKTANLVLGAAFGVPGMVVDTHVARISQRLGLTENKNPEKIEFDLMRLIPENDWNDFSLWLIYFGREICAAKKPKCRDCMMSQLCPCIGGFIDLAGHRKTPP